MKTILIYCRTITIKRLKEKKKAELLDKYVKRFLSTDIRKYITSIKSIPVF